MRKVVFKKGLELNGRKFGWLNGQLFLVKEVGKKRPSPCKITGVHMPRKGFCYVIDRKKFTVQELTAMTKVVKFVCWTEHPEEWFLPMFADIAGSDRGGLIYGKGN